MLFLPRFSDYADKDIERVLEPRAVGDYMGAVPSGHTYEEK